MAHIDGWRRPLHFSAKNSSHELVKYFADIRNGISLKENDGINCLHNAALYGQLSLCKSLTCENNFDVQTTDNDGWTQPQFFSKYGSLELFTYFAGMEIDVLTKVKGGKSCIQIEAHVGHLKLCEKLIHKHKFNLHVSENDRWKTFHYSAEKGSYKLVAYFVDIGTDIQLNIYDEKTGLHVGAL